MIVSAASIASTARIKRVVSCFLLSSGNPSNRDSLRVAVFHRQETMPTFPSHWAPCSGSIEEGESPHQTALREIQEETNLKSQNIKMPLQYGLYVDVPFRQDTIIRVYPFAVELPPTFTLALEGTEHDRYEFVSVAHLEQLEPAVPGLATAFHHATFGQYLDENGLVEHDRVREWASDHVSGASSMAKNALKLISSNRDDQHAAGGAAERTTTTANSLADRIAMMRPTMVAITNAMNLFKKLQSPDSVLEAVQQESQHAVDMAAAVVQSILQGLEHKERQQTPSNQSYRRQKFHMAVFSRSSTLVAVLQKLQLEYDLHVTCARSTPGDEGVLMAQDVGGECVEDGELLDRLNQVNVVLVGSDCIMECVVYNKIGTKALAQVAQAANVPVVCCGDAFKVWDDIFPPPLEEIFEEVPRDLFHQVVY